MIGKRSRISKTLFPLATHAVFLGLIPFAVLGLSSRFLSDVDIRLMVQSWVAFNLFTITIFGTLEANIPRLVRRGHGFRTFFVIWSILSMIAIVVSLISVHIIGLELSSNQIIGFLIAVLLHGAHSVVRGALIAQGMWKSLAVATILQSFVTLLPMALIGMLGVLSFSDIFQSMTYGYAVILVFGLILRIEPLSKRGSGKGLTEVFPVLGFIVSAALANLLPALPVLLGTFNGFTSDELLILVTAPYLVRIVGTIANASTPWFIANYSLAWGARKAALKLNALILLIPTVLATALLGVIAELFFPFYLGRAVTFSLWAVLGISLGEALISTLTAFRAFDISSNKSLRQLLVWSFGICSFLTLSHFSKSDELGEIAAYFLISSSLTLGLQVFLTWKGERHALI